MNIAIVTAASGIEKSMVACNLATQRLLAGHRTLLIDGDSQKFSMLWSIERCAAGIKPPLAIRAITGKGLLPELENLSPHYSDIVIDAETRDCLSSRSALIAARKAVVLVQSNQLDLAQQDGLIRRIETARLSNPGLQVRIVVVITPSAFSGYDQTAMRVFVSRIPAAILSGTVIHSTNALRSAFSAGMAMPEYRPTDNIAHADLTSLYREVFES